MNIIVLAFALAVIPTVIGCGATKLYLGIKGKILKADSPRRESAFCRFAVYFSSGSVIILALSGFINALAVLTHMTVSKGGKLFCISSGIFFIISALIILISCIKTSKSKKKPARNSNATSLDKKTVCLAIIAVIVSLVQLISVAQGHRISYSGDQTVETVVSFISTDNIYSVDPLTGLPYLNGYPFRLSLQCLPFLYSVLCNTFSIAPTVMVWQIMPTFWLVCGYCTIIRLTDSLFKKNHYKLIMFLSFEFILYCTDAAAGATGFEIFHRGYSSVMVLELLLIYWTIGSVLSRNSLTVLLTIAIEPLVASTRFGVGACFFIAAICIILSRIPLVRRINAALEERTGGGNGEA